MSSDRPADEISDDEMEDLLLIPTTPNAIGAFLEQMEEGGHEIEAAVFEPPAADERGSSTVSVELRWDGEEELPDPDDIGR